MRMCMYAHFLCLPCVSSPAWCCLYGRVIVFRGGGIALLPVPEVQLEARLLLCERARARACGGLNLAQRCQCGVCAVAICGVSGLRPSDAVCVCLCVCASWCVHGVASR